MTGASGFIGQAVVATFLGRGHAVRVSLREHGGRREFPWRDEVEVRNADVRSSADLEAAVEGVDAVVHLAAALEAGDEQQFATTVAGTEHLLAAMDSGGVARLVLISSIAVYDWAATEGTLSEASPLETDIYGRDGYAVSKWWQERVARREVERRPDLGLTVLRPGFVWGAGREYVAGTGISVGPVHMVLGPGRPLPLTYVDNCADCIVTATEEPGTVGATLNVIDFDPPTAWRYAGIHLTGTGTSGVRIPLPYAPVLALVRAFHGVMSRLVGASLRLPGILVPRQLEARCKPLHFSTAQLERTLRWRPPLSFDECVRRTFPRDVGLK